MIGETMDWALLSEAVDHYRRLGFKYVDTPWAVEPDIAGITCPEWGALDMIGDKALVASAEQGFLQLQADGKLDSANYVSCGPCFRPGDEGRSPYHKPYFMKVELFVRCIDESTAIFAAKELVTRARNFMNKDCKIVKLGDKEWDLELYGHEVGSYGARYHDLVGHWAYGTGLALPRFTQAVADLENRDEISD